MCYTGTCPYERRDGPNDTRCVLPPGYPCYMGEHPDDYDEFDDYGLPTDFDEFFEYELLGIPRIEEDSW